MIKVGIIGVGTIGSELAKACVFLFKDEVRLVGVIDQNVMRESKVRKLCHLRRRYSLNELATASDLLIESAQSRSAYKIAILALSSGKDVMIMSTGGLIGHEKEIQKLARDHRCCLYIPSGAIAGVDALKSADIGRIQSVSLTTRKAPRGFKGAPWVIKRKINLDKIRKETLLFEGSARKAISGFPQNINISAALSMAGIGSSKTRVRVYACPGLRHHIHEVIVKGDFGTFYTKTKNHPSKNNPKTSRLAILSAIATLKRILNNVKIGT